MKIVPFVSGNEKEFFFEWKLIEWFDLFEVVGFGVWKKGSFEKISLALKGETFLLRFSIT